MQPVGMGGCSSVTSLLQRGEALGYGVQCVVPGGLHSAVALFIQVARVKSDPLLVRSDHGGTKVWGHVWGIFSISRALVT